MRRYETIVILDPDLSEENRTAFSDRVKKEIIPKFEGVLLAEDVWGNRRLAYEINKKPRGFYIRYDYCGLGTLVDELERSFRIDDRVMRYLTVVLDKDADAESLLAEMQASEQQQAPAEKTAQAPAGETDQAPEAETEQPEEPDAQEVTAQETAKAESGAESTNDAPASDPETSKEDE